MTSIVLYTFASIMIVSCVSFVGVFTLSFSRTSLERFLLPMVSFAAGAMFGDAFLHLLPELIETGAYTLRASFVILSGILLMFFLEKVVHWHHGHHIDDGGHVHRFAVMNLFGDCLHNFLDGLIIAGSYLVSIPVGIATTIAVVLHEIPQEIGDFGVLMHGGFSKWQALFFNFLTGLTAVLGGVVALILAGASFSVEATVVPLAIGAFLYIAGSDLIPELHKEMDTRRSLFQFFALGLGIAVMALFLFLE